MGVIIDVTKNPVLMRMYREAQQIAQQEPEQKVRAEAEAAGRAKGVAEGRAEGRAEGMAEGESEILRKQLTAKFGSLPRWAAGRVSKATPTQIERWAQKNSGGRYTRRRARPAPSQRIVALAVSSG